MADTNVCIDVIRKRSRSLVERIRAQAVDDIAISAITLSDLQHGVHTSESPEQNRVALLEFLVPFTVLTYDDTGARVYGDIRAHLEKPALQLDQWTCSSQLTHVHAVSY